MKLFVGNLPWKCFEIVLAAFFEAHGIKVQECLILRDRITGRSRGFGFVTLQNPEDRDKAMRLSGERLSGRAIVVNLAKERT